MNKGEFSFKSGNKTIEGKICTWSLNRFCEKMNIPNVTEMFSAVTTGISIRAIAEILLCAVEYKFRGKDFPYTVDDAMDWIDCMGGLKPTCDIITASLSSDDEDEKPKKKAVKNR